MRTVMGVVYRVLLARPWGAAFWAFFYSSISKGRRSPRHGEHVAAIRRSMGRPDRLRSFRELAIALDHSVVEARLPALRAPALAVVGALDPDFSDPAAELAWITDTIEARGVLIPDVGHYPQHQAPDVVVPAVLDFLAELPAQPGPELPAQPAPELPAQPAPERPADDATDAHTESGGTRA